jgi:hypothetical protein
MISLEQQEQLQSQQVWVDAFARRLMTLWPQVDLSDAEHVGEALCQEPAWHDRTPELAADAWVTEAGASHVQATGADPLIA